MAVLKCVVDGCSTELTTNEPVSEIVRYICKNHPRSVQAAAAGRTYDQQRDEADRDVHFQDVQFDPDLARSANPLRGMNQEIDDRSDIINA